jgi:protein SCO1/2
MIAMSVIQRSALRTAVLTMVALAGAATGAQAQGGVPGEAGVNEKLGAQVALDAVLRDEDGKDITLRQLIDKPTILTLNYFTCTGICSPLLNGLVDCFNQLGLEPGRDFQVITVSFDPSDKPEVAHQKRINYLRQMKRPFPPEAWRFLTGSAQATRTVTDSVGFIFRPAEGGGFVHPGVIVVLTAKGIVSRYMYGISFLPADMQMAVQEAAAGQIRPTISRILAFCYSYDPQSRSYVLSMTRVTGVVVLLFAAGFVLFLLKGKPRSNKDKTGLSA